MNNQQGINSYQDYAKKLVTEYDMLIKRGFQIINNVSIQKGNTDLMESQIILAHTLALQKKNGLYTIINGIGNGIIGYWTGATLNTFPTPVIPAVGSFQNISTTSALVTNPGKFPNMGTQTPITDSEIYLDQLIAGITLHLTTIEGMYNTISLYPSVPPAIAPGFLEWTAYTIPAES